MSQFHASKFKDRLHALLTTRPLPQMNVDLACWRRLEAMRERMEKEDSTLVDVPDAMEHVIYAAIMGGLAESEREAGVTYNENTGEKIA